MNKTVGYILIVILALLTLWLGTFMVFSISNGGFEFGNLDEVIKEEKYDLTEIKNLKFDFVSSDVEFFVGNSNELRVVQYGNKKSEEFIDNVSSSSIEILDDTKINFMFFNFQYGSRYEIYLPNDYANNLDIKTVSGEIDLNDFTLNINDFNVKTTSGDISLRSIINSKNTEIKSISGEIVADELINNDVSIKTTSGDINIEKAYSKEITVSSVSGELTFDSVEGIVKFKTTSGDVDINDLRILNNSSISTISGEVSIRMNDNNDCIITTKTLSGDTNISTNKYGNMKHDLNIKTTSGDIKVD